jgi:hypothetical protein
MRQQSRPSGKGVSAVGYGTARTSTQFHGDFKNLMNNMKKIE